MDSSRVIGKPHANPHQSEGKLLVSKITSTGDLKGNILKAVDLIGGFEKTIEKGDAVLLKPNFNSADPPPASHSPDFLRALVELLFDQGAREVVVAESSMQGTSTRRIMEKAGALNELKDTGAEVVFFDEEKWMKTKVGGKFLADVSLAMRALSVDKLVYSCCMKTHFRADFSLSLKLAFGFTKGSERMGFHLRHLKEKLVDLNLVVNPNLIIMDGRKCFITGGPFHGEVREPNLIMASGDRIAMDVESIKVIEGFEDANLSGNPWGMTQIRQAVELGLGVRSEQEYKVLLG